MDGNSTLRPGYQSSDLANSGRPGQQGTEASLGVRAARSVGRAQDQYRAVAPHLAWGHHALRHFKPRHARQTEAEGHRSTAPFCQARSFWDKSGRPILRLQRRAPKPGPGYPNWTPRSERRDQVVSAETLYLLLSATSHTSMRPGSGPVIQYWLAGAGHRVRRG